MKNPYRQILRRQFPEPVLALLIFLMGVWLWDNHLGPDSGYERDACRMALLKLDRDLRLADAGRHLPALARTAFSIDEPGDVVEDGAEALGKLGREGALDEDGAFALVVLHSLSEGTNPVEGPFTAAGMPGPPDPRIVAARILESRDYWWDREYLRGIGDSGGPEFTAGLHGVMEDGRNLDLLERALVARGAVLGLIVLGLVFLPRTLRAFAGALKSVPRGYPGAWSANSGLGVFLLAYLASIGFGKAIDLVISGQRPFVGELVFPAPVLAALDSATRLLPAMVALALLFRRGGHALSRLGIAAMPSIPLVLGSFALLEGIDFVLQRVLGESLASDPTGGLSSLEAGAWGLVLALSSACVAAPVAEEIVYRGVLFRSLANRIRVPAATLVSAAVFSLVHFYNLYGLVSVAFTGAACALCFAACGRLATAIALHALYNFAIKVPEWMIYHAPL